MPDNVLKENGFKKLSRYVWTNGHINITKTGKRISKVDGKQKEFWQRIEGFRGSGKNDIYANQVIKCCR